MRLWTGRLSSFGEYHVANLLAAHCTGIEAAYQLRAKLGLNRQTAVVAGVGLIILVCEQYCGWSSCEVVAGTRPVGEYFRLSLLFPGILCRAEEHPVCS